MIINGKDIFEEQFITKLLDYEQWISKADQLIDAAKALEHKMKETWKDWGNFSSNQQENLRIDDRFFSTYFMLSSFAVENMLKAIILKNNIKYIRQKVINSKKLPSILKGHDLLELSNRANLPYFANDNEEYLRKLTRSAVWYGRYPVPVQHSDLNVVFTSEVDKTIFTVSSYSSTDIEEVDRLLRELKVILSA